MLDAHKSSECRSGEWYIVHIATGPHKGYDTLHLQGQLSYMLLVNILFMEHVGLRYAPAASRCIGKKMLEAC